MNVEEYKKLAINKIEADALAKQVRDVIKITKWQKQDDREGFKESYQPLISQFEKPEDSQTSNIYTQNQEMINNQIKVAKEVERKRKATDEVSKQLERLMDMGEVAGFPKKVTIEKPEILDPWDQSWVPKHLQPSKDSDDEVDQEELKKLRKIIELENKFNGEELKMLNFYGLTLPKEFSSTNLEILEKQYQNLNDNIKELNGRILGRKNTKYPSPLYLEETKILKETQGTLYKYKNALNDYFKDINYKLGSGIYFYNSPQELLGGSLAAGNNGVLPEYIQITHQLRDLGVVNNNQLNKLLKNYIAIK